MTMLTLRLLEQTFAIHSLAPNSQIPNQIFDAPIYFLAKTHDELSIVIPEEYAINSEEVESNWRALEVVGPLGFSLTGILANISTVLANEEISIFAISTFDTDYILVKNDKVDAAKNALQNNNYHVI